MQLTRDFTDDIQGLKQRLGSDTAIISHVSGKDYKVLAVVSQVSSVRPGGVYELGNTYCREVIDRQDTVIYNQVGTIEAMLLHPVYTALQLEAYIGEPLRQDGAIIGTLNFSAFLPKRPPFSAADIEDVKALARRVEAALSA